MRKNKQTNNQENTSAIECGRRGMKKLDSSLCFWYWGQLIVIKRDEIHWEPELNGDCESVRKVMRDGVKRLLGVRLVGTLGGGVGVECC